MIKFKFPSPKISKVKKVFFIRTSTIKEKYLGPFQLKISNYLTQQKLSLHNYFKIINQIKIPTINLKNTQSKIEETISSVNDEVILKQSTYWAKLLTWSLMGGTTLGVSWLAIAKTEEISLKAFLQNTIRIAIPYLPLIR